MKTFLKKFRFPLKTTGPVFVGSGDAIHKKEYLFDPRNCIFSFVDTNRMFGELRKLKADRIYEDYLLKENGGDLSRFFRDAKISSDQYGKWIVRKLEASDASFKDLTPKMVMSFMRDGRGNAYIPGSSLKGAIRTALMNHLLKGNQTQKVSEIRNDVRGKQDKKWLDSVEEKLDTALLHRGIFPESKKPEDKVNSFMRGIIVSDSESISDADLFVCQKIDVDRFGKVRGKRLPLLRECIKPGVTVNFTITLDTNIFPYTMSELVEMIKEFDRDYETLFTGVFDKTYKKATGSRIFLGGGAGFLSKTVNYSLFGKKEAVDLTSRILALQFKNGKHENDRGMGLSPRLLKCTKVHGELYPMGECQLMKIEFLNKEGI